MLPALVRCECIAGIFLPNSRLNKKLNVFGDWRVDSVVKLIIALAEDLGLIPSTHMVTHNNL